MAFGLACVESTPEHGRWQYFFGWQSKVPGVGRCHSKPTCFIQKKYCKCFHLQQPRKIHVDRPSSYAQAGVPCELGCSANQLTLHLQFAFIKVTAWQLVRFDSCPLLVCNLVVALFASSCACCMSAWSRVPIQTSKAMR